MITTAKPNQARPSAWAGLLLLALLLLDASLVCASRVLNLDGVDDFAREPVGTASPSTFDLTTFTVEAWVFPTETLGSWFVFSDSGYDRVAFIRTSLEK